MSLTPEQRQRVKRELDLRARVRVASTSAQTGKQPGVCGVCGSNVAGGILRSDCFGCRRRLKRLAAARDERTPA